MPATEFIAREDLKYLYVKDRTWTMIGAAAGKALPERARSANKVAKDIKAGISPGGKKAPQKSQAIIEGLGNCFYPFIDSPPGHKTAEKKATPEIFACVISGTVEAQVGRDTHRAKAGDGIHIPRGSPYHLAVYGRRPARYAAVRSTDRFEAASAKHSASDNWRD